MTEAINQLRAQRGAALRARLSQLLLSAGAVGLGAGAVGRLATGGISAAQSQLRPHSTYTPDAPLVVEVPVSSEEEKRANPTESPYSDAARFMVGDYARSVPEMPLAIPAMTATLAGTLYGGWRGADMLIDRLRRKKLDSEMARVKARYQRALGIGGNDEKTAADDEPGLGQVFERWKSALLGMNNADDTLGPAGGVLGVGAVPVLSAGATSALLAYALARRRGPNNIVARARKEYENDLQRQRPPAIMAVPTGRIGEDDDR